MPREPEFWGGELLISRWLRETPVGKSDPVKHAEDMLGADSIFLPRDVRRARER